MPKQTTTAPSDIRKAIEPDQSLFKFSLLSLVGSSIGIAVAAALLFMLVINGSNRQLTSTVFEAHAQTYAHSVNQSLAQLETNLLHISQASIISEAFLASSDELRAQEQRLLAHIPNLVSVRLIPLGEKVLTPAQAGISFPEIDMINRANRGQQVPAEAHSLNQQRVVRLVTLIKADDQAAGTIASGAVIATYHLDVFNDQLQQFDRANGSMKIEQAFGGKAPQSFLQYGNAFNSEQPILTTALQNPLWQVSF